MKTNPKAPTTVTIAVLTVITILFWIGFEVFHVLTQKPAPTVPREILLPLSPTLDSDTLTKLQQRVYLTEDEIGNSVIEVKGGQKTVPPTATTPPIPSASPTPNASATPIASSSPTP